MAPAALMTAAMTAVCGEAARHALMVSAGRAHARRYGATTWYRVTLAGRLVFDAAILIMGGLAAMVLYHGDDWRIAALLGGFAALSILAYPGAILVDENGIQTRRWYRRPVRIGWHEIADLRHMDQVGQTVVVSHSGRQIVHTSLHADRTVFRREVITRAGLIPRIVA